MMARNTYTYLPKNLKVGPTGFFLPLSNSCFKSLSKLMIWARIDTSKALIGSSHIINGNDPYYPEFWEGKSIKEAVMSYFEAILRNVTTYENYDVYGHLDYINRYSHYEDNSLEYKDYSDIIDEILKVLVSKGKGLDINTSGYRYGLGRTNPQLDIVKRFKELGGEIVTVGSDAHKPEDVGAYFAEAYAMLKEAGFKYTASFRNKKATMVKL